MKNSRQYLLVPHWTQVFWGLPPTYKEWSSCCTSYFVKSYLMPQIEVLH